MAPSQTGTPMSRASHSMGQPHKSTWIPGHSASPFFCLPMEGAELHGSSAQCPRRFEATFKNVGRGPVSCGGHLCGTKQIVRP